jgi:hypothetical protein
VGAESKATTTFIADLHSRAVRSRSVLHRPDKWVVRRLAPDCTKIEMVGSAGRALRNEAAARDWRETGNVHLANDVSAVTGDLSNRPKSWLRNSASEWPTSSHRTGGLAIS